MFSTSCRGGDCLSTDILSHIPDKKTILPKKNYVKDPAFSLDISPTITIVDSVFTHRPYGLVTGFDRDLEDGEAIRRLMR